MSLAAPVETVGGASRVRPRDAIAVALIAGLAASPNLLGPINTYDGGLAGSSATFLLHGQLPYKDFWWLYGPLSSGVVAAFTALFGPSLLLLRLLGLVLLMTQAGLGYALLRSTISHLGAAIVAIAAVIGGAVLFPLEISAWSLSLTLALATLAVRGLMPARPLLAGVLVGITFLARFDVGGYVLLACLALPDRRAVLAGFAVVAVPLAAALVLTTPLGSLYEQIIWFPLVGQRQFRGLPGPQIADAMAWLVYLPIVAIPKLAIVAAAIRLALVRVRPPVLVALAIFATLCQLQTQGRGDISHQAQAAAPGFLLLGVWLMGSEVARSGLPNARWRLRLPRLAPTAVVCVACAFAIVTGALSVTWIAPRPLDSSDAGFIAGVRTVRASTRRDEPIFVGLTSHQFTTFNPMLAYYLADRRAGVRIAMFNPGVTNTEPVQREMVKDLIETQTQVLLLDAEFALHAEGSNESRLPGSRLLDEYISATFVNVCTFGETRILATVGRAPSISCAEPTDESLGSVLSGLR